MHWFFLEENHGILKLDINIYLIEAYDDIEFSFPSDLEDIIVKEVEDFVQSTSEYATTSLPYIKIMWSSPEFIDDIEKKHQVILNFLEIESGRMPKINMKISLIREEDYKINGSMYQNAKNRFDINKF